MRPASALSVQWHRAVGAKPYVVPRFFRYTRYELPMRYNLNFKFLDGEGLGPGGLQPAVLHFADPEDKLQLFHAVPGSKAWRYLCYQPELQQSAQS